MTLVPLTRRRFLATGSGALAVTCLGALGACATVPVRRITPVNGRIELPLLQHPELATSGGALRVQVPGSDTPIDVLVLGTGQYAALSPICTHLGCTVEVQGAYLVCPCHGSTYERTGKVVRGPAERPLRRYPASLSSSQVVIIELEGTAGDA
ncbi:MAG: Rieske (2Fe-2S) protein [Cytophagaceae bacterium]|nr:Rieske (2Fe-2S) protein [Gemmatimonadaceae bacterium]